MSIIQRSANAAPVTPRERRERRRRSFTMRTRGDLLQVVGRRVALGVACVALIAGLLPSPVGATPIAGEALLGDSTSASVVPVAVRGGTQPQVAVGENHTCALLTDGTVRCWGSGSNGRLGDGEDTARLHPVQVLVSGTAESNPVVLDGVAQIALGNNHTCALLTDETVRCWGRNSSGQLGDGSTTERLHPVQVLDSGTTPLRGVTQIDAGGNYTCALLTDQTVRCWGQGNNRQLGDGDTQDRLNPVQVLASVSTPLEGVIRVSAGKQHTCALLIGGTVRCWGDGGRGRLGDGESTSRSFPVAVLVSGTASASPVALEGVTQISAGNQHSCALLTDGTARCWGDGGAGQLGDGDTQNQPNPVEVLASASTPFEGMTQIAAGSQHSCALLTDGTARCWGEGSTGRLGDGESTTRSFPVAVLESGTASASPVVLDGIAQISVSIEDRHACAVVTDGTVRCWGSGSSGRLGDGETTTRPNPVVVLASGTATVDPVVFSVGILTVSSGGAVPSALALVCSSNVQVGAEITCTVSGGDAGIDILWRAAYNPVFAGEGVTLDASGSGEFAFMVPAAALGQELTVELVEWTAPISLGVVGGPVPSSVPSGGGPVSVWTLGLLALFGFGLLRRGMRAQA
jgi:alpha-tubulin suppressor-like RCC1 family protein